MSLDWYQDVLDFHVKLAPDKIGTVPAIPSPDIDDLRMKMIGEEYAELRKAYLVGNVPLVADSIADLIYVLLGMAISYGIDMRPVWDAVQAANMAKEGGPIRPDGKILKPVGWVHPDIAGILERQGPLV